MSEQDTWTAVDSFFDGLFAPPDPVLSEALDAADQAGLPAIQVSPGQGALLNVLARAHSARTILEIGTLGGYSTIWLARAMPEDGRLITLEVEPAHAAVAWANFERAGLSAKIELILGPASVSLRKLAEASAGPFDLVFIDADKASTPEYLTLLLPMTRPGSLIIVDNVVRSGAVADPASLDPDVQGVRRALEMFSADPRFVGAAVQTVGRKGYDGLAIALVAGG